MRRPVRYFGHPEAASRSESVADRCHFGTEQRRVGRPPRSVFPFHEHREVVRQVPTACGRLLHPLEHDPGGFGGKSRVLLAQNDGTGLSVGEVLFHGGDHRADLDVGFDRVDFPRLRIDVDQRDVAEVAVRVPEPGDRPAHERVTPAHQDVAGFEREAGAEIRVHKKGRCRSGENPVLVRKGNEMLCNILAHEKGCPHRLPHGVHAGNGDGTRGLHSCELPAQIDFGPEDFADDGLGLSFHPRKVEMRRRRAEKLGVDLSEERGASIGVERCGRDRLAEHPDSHEQIPRKGDALSGTRESRHAQLREFPSVAVRARELVARG